jgi:predicted lipoprotein with Yx(FWY)xxD motif
MKRICMPAAGALAALASVSALANARPSVPSAGAARVTKVGLRHTSIGTILVTSAGFTLYRFTRDPRNKDTCVEMSECSSTWPALRTTGKPIAGPGVKTSLLSSISLPGGGKQVTYARHPLYTYAPASERGETAYVGAMQFGGTWDAVSASGSLVK